MEEWAIYLIAGIIVVTISLLRYNIKRQRRDAQKQAERQAAVQAAREAELKRQREMGQEVKRNVSHSQRMPLPEPVDTPFTGSTTPRSIARWETEIHELGRQVTAKIDTKMLALQTLTVEANRAANRLELLLEQFEGILRHTQKPGSEENENEQIAKSASKNETLPPSVVRPVEKDLDAAAFADLLDDLESEVENFEEDMKNLVRNETDETRPVTILKPEMIEESQTTVVEPMAVLKMEKHANVSVMPTAAKPKEREGLSLESLYDNGLAEREKEQVFAVAGPSGSKSASKKETVTLTGVRKSGRDPHLELRKQVEMLADYGNTPRQIAQNLDITLGEVDLILSLRD